METNLNNFRWCFALALTTERGKDGLQYIEHVGPMPTERIEELVGGPYELRELRDRTCLAVRTEQQGLEPNPHYPGLNGLILVGKLSEGHFVGMLGIQLS